jgi:hypothetical protein
MHPIQLFASIMMVILMGYLTAEPVMAQTQPKWIIAHKVNQIVHPYRRLATNLPADHYPQCFGDVADLRCV